VFSAFSKAFAQLQEPSFRRVFWLGLIGSLAVFVASWVVIGVGFAYWDLPTIDLWITDVDLDRVKEVFGGIGVLILSWILFPAVITFVIGFFLETIADAVDARYYPGLGAPRRQSIGEIILITLKFSAIAVFLNILTLPLLLALIFTPFYPFVFYTVNGYLLGREYYELVAHRRIDPRDAKHVRKNFSGSVFVAGVVIAFLMTIPIINLLAPVVATAAMVHLVERWRARSGAIG